MVRDGNVLQTEKQRIFALLLSPGDCGEGESVLLLRCDFAPTGLALRVI
jgi:hypothetical protein